MNGGPQPRVSSPAPVRSILITSAPRSARICPAHGPARMRASSRTRIPASGPGMEDSYTADEQKLRLEPHRLKVLPDQVARRHIPAPYVRAHHHNALPPQQRHRVGLIQHTALETAHGPITQFRIRLVLLPVEQLVDRTVGVAAAVLRQIDGEMPRELV